jgi:hypothetical protein
MLNTASRKPPVPSVCRLLAENWHKKKSNKDRRQISLIAVAAASLLLFNIDALQLSGHSANKSPCVRAAQH